SRASCVPPGRHRQARRQRAGRWAHRQRQCAADSGRSVAGNGQQREQGPVAAVAVGPTQPGIRAREDGPDEMRFLLEGERREAHPNGAAPGVEYLGGERLLRIEAKERKPDLLALGHGDWRAPAWWEWRCTRRGTSRRPRTRTNDGSGRGCARCTPWNGSGAAGRTPPPRAAAR